MSSKNYSISLCTVCMNRLQHLRYTLPQNISDNQKYENVQFILLDYNSGDGLEEYVIKNWSQYIESEKLIYYRAAHHLFFNRSHSRNVLFRLAKGEILVNLDADNYTGQHFCDYVNKKFNKSENMFLTTIKSVKQKSGKKYTTDVLGRICFKKKDFVGVRGFDEKISEYGFEDYDFVNRLEMTGLKRKLINNGSYLQSISHQVEHRLGNEKGLLNLHSLFLCYLTPASTIFVFLYKDLTFVRGTIVDNYVFNHNLPVTKLKQTELAYKYGLAEDHWESGHWYFDGNDIKLSELQYGNDVEFELNLGFNLDKEKFYKITDHELILEAVMIKNQSYNRLIMNENILNRSMSVNSEFGFGKDIVYKNFDYSIAINLK